MTGYEIKERLDKLSYKLKEDETEYNITQEKDKSLKTMFEVKKQFIELIKTFVKEKWVELLNEENIELADKEFIMSNMHQRRADLIYRLKSQDIYFILMEFQSTKDKKMPYRLLSYMLEIWRKYEEEKLPVVIPCVLYTGNKKWDVKTFRSLFKENKEIEKYIPDFDYILIDINNYTDEDLIKTANLVSTVVYMAKAKNKNEVADKLENIFSIIKKLSIKDQNTFVKWAEGMFYKCGAVYEYIEEKIYKEKEDNKMLLADLMPEAIEVIKERASVKARKECKIEGVIKILTKKLNVEPNLELIKLFEIATEEKLNKVEDKIFEIETWEEVEEIIK